MRPPARCTTSLRNTSAFLSTPMTSADAGSPHMRLFRVIAILLALFALSPLAQAQAPASACTLAPVAGEMRELTSGGRTRTYRLFVPPQVAGQTRLPLVLDLHGSGGNAAGQAKTSGFETLAAREGFAVATLQAE